MKTGKMILAIILSVLALVVAQAASQLIASVVMLVKIPTFVGNILAGVLYIIFAYLLVRLLCTKFLKEEMSSYNIPSFKLEVKWCVVAFLLPISVAAIYLLFVPGSFEKNSLDINSKLDLISAGIFFIGFGAGIVEEMVFRGIMMGVVEKRFNKTVAIIVPSLLFGLVHIMGMGFNLLSCILVVLAGTMVGVMFSLIASATKSVWNSAIVHAVWNMVIIGGFLWIGTELDEYSLITYKLDVTSFWLTGGEFGIESSIVAVIGYSLVCMLVLLDGKKRGKKE